MNNEKPRPSRIKGFTRAADSLGRVLDAAVETAEGTLLPALADERFRRHADPGAIVAEFAALLKANILDELNHCPTSGPPMDEIDCDLYVEAASKAIKNHADLLALRKEIRRLAWRPRYPEFVLLVDRATGGTGKRRSEIDGLPPGERQAYQPYKGPYEEDAERSGQKLIPAKSHRAYIDDILRRNRARAQKSDAANQGGE